MAQSLPGKPHIVSPSQIATFNECQRKWAWRAVAKVVVPQAASAAKGTLVHKQLERYLGGEPIDWSDREIGNIAQSTTHLLPPPKAKGIQIEKHFTLNGPSGTPYQGYIDLLAEDSSVFPNMPPQTGLFTTPAVCDHKTTSNLAYAKTPTILRTDPQGVIYAKFAMEYFSSSEADLMWHYISTRGSNQAKRVHLRVLKSDVDREFAKIDLVGFEIATIHRAQTTPLDLPPNTNACSAYGGCPHHPSKGGGCTDLSVINPSRKTMTPETTNMLNDLQSRNGAVTPQASASLLDSLLPSMSAPVTSPLPSTDILNPFVSQGVTATEVTKTPVAINPPGEAAPVSMALLPQPVTTTAPVEEKTKKARRTKAQMIADESAVSLVPLHDPAINAYKEVVLGGGDGLIQNQTATTRTGFTLYVDCLPVGEPYTPAEKIYALAAIKIKESGHDDYRLIKYEGAGIFAALVNEIVDQYNGTQDIVLNSSTPEGAIALAGLSSRATRVIRGTR